jgi:hypothetical protein
MRCIGVEHADRVVIAQIGTKVAAIAAGNLVGGIGVATGAQEIVNCHRAIMAGQAKFG